MALIVADRVKETSTTTGTGAFTLAGAMTGFRAFSAVCAVADTCYYCIQAVDGDGNPTGEWEVGSGTYSAANTLTRTTVLSSSTGSAVNFAAGTKQVWVDLAAAQVLPVLDKGYAYLSAAANTTTAGWQKVPLDATSWDTNSLWDAGNTNFLPKKAGYYMLQGRVRKNTGTVSAVGIGKNGALAIVIGGDATTLANGGGCFLHANGTTDTFDLRVYTTTANALTTGVFDTHLQVTGPF